MRDWRRRDLFDEPGETYPTGVKPGAATLTQHLPVQRRSVTPATPSPAPAIESFGFVQAYGGEVASADGAPFPDEVPMAWMSAPSVQQAASLGTSGASGPLPFLATIQPLFGRHDVTGVQSHTDAAAATGARAMGAEAFAHGDHVAFGGAPTLHTAAHEAAHVVQQRGGVALKGGVGERGDVYERHADAVADRVVRGESAEALLDPMAGRGGDGSARAVQKVDQRDGVEIPDAATQADIESELFPASTSVGGAPVSWDGASGQPDRRRNRRTFRREMHRAMRAHLRAAMGGTHGINAVRRQPRLPTSDLEGAGRQAKVDADAHFAAFATAAALTTSQETARISYTVSASGADQNLFDAQDAGDRRTVGMAIDATDLADWIAETDSDCVAARQAHHFDDTRSVEERNFLRDSIVAPFVVAHRRDLRRYDLHGFAMSNPDTGQIVLPTSLPIGLSTTASGGVPSDAERGLKWRSWRTMVHEYIHQLEHPTLRAWPRRNRTISEGFCEYFTKQVLLPLLPTAGGADVARRTAIEGADNGAPSSVIMGGAYDAGEYAEYLARAEAIEGHLGGAAVGAQNAMKAIFFQGHLELLGYDNAGGAVTAPAGSSDEIQVPATLTTFSALGTAVNVPEADLRAANAGMSEPLAGRLHAPGCREHRVVSSHDAVGSRAETATVIATQHDVTVAALTAANPGVDFTALTSGQRIIIPRH